MNHLYAAAEAQHLAWVKLKKWLGLDKGYSYLSDPRYKAVEEYYATGYRLAVAQVLSDINNYGLDEARASFNRYLIACDARDEEQK